MSTVPLLSSVPLRDNPYGTRFKIRLDFEAPLAYLLGAISGILLLILETRNDYVRFHAWQSTLIAVSNMVEYSCNFLDYPSCIWILAHFYSPDSFGTSHNFDHIFDVQGV